VSKDGKSAQRLLLVLRLTETNTGSLAPLLALKSDAAGAGEGEEKYEKSVTNLLNPKPLTLGVNPTRSSTNWGGGG
jgi:hypothetical protein